MLPVVAGDGETRKQILIYTLILAPLGVAPWLLGYTGIVYGLVAVATGAVMLWLALKVYGEKPTERQPAARSLFGFSLLYLFVLFAALLADRALQFWAPGFA